jgi:ACT domain-containing protein
MAGVLQGYRGQHVWRDPDGREGTVAISSDPLLFFGKDIFIPPDILLIGLMPGESQYHTRTEESMSKTIITVVGKDAVGIIAKICTYLADNRVNVEDISQTIVQGYFNMMMIVDTSGSKKPYAGMVTELEDLGDEIGVKIRCQREDIFTKMHRI